MTNTLRYGSTEPVFFTNLYCTSNWMKEVWEKLLWINAHARLYQLDTSGQTNAEQKSVHCKQLYSMQYWWSTLLGAALGKEAQEHAKHCGKLTGIFNFTMTPQVPYAFHKKQTSLRPKNLASFFSFSPLSLPLKGTSHRKVTSSMAGKQELESWMHELVVTQSRHRIYKN